MATLFRCTDVVHVLVCYLAAAACAAAAAACAAAAGASKLNVHETHVFDIKFKNPDFFAKVSADELDRSPLIVFALGAIHLRKPYKVSADR